MRQNISFHSKDLRKGVRHFYLIMYYIFLVATFKFNTFSSINHIDTPKFVKSQNNLIYNHGTTISENSDLDATIKTQTLPT